MPMLTPTPPPEASNGDPLGTAFAKLLGRTPSPEEVQELYRVRDALNLRDNDALWLVLLALQHQRREWEGAIDERLANAKETADAILDTARAQFLQQMPAELRKLAKKLTVPATGYPGPVVVSGLLVGLMLLIVGVGAVGYWPSGRLSRPRRPRGRGESSRASFSNPAPD